MAVGGDDELMVRAVVYVEDEILKIHQWIPGR